MNLPKLSSADLKGKKVILRVDLDVPLSKEGATYGVKDNSRIKAWLPTLKYILDGGAQSVFVLGHIGRPAEGERISNAVVSKEFECVFVEDVFGKGIPSELSGALRKVFLLENLRFNEGEEKNDKDFAQKLAELGDLYVNEAFAVSHRKHASMVLLPGLLPHFAGLRFFDEVQKITQLMDSPKRPSVAVISGVKQDKVEMSVKLAGKFDKVLVGGKLPVYFNQQNPNPDKIILASLLPDGEDITLNSVSRFKSEISNAATIVLAGVPGRYEDEGHRQGTREVFLEVAESRAFKMAGGGHTETAINMLNLRDKFDWISVGGGAMLELMAEGTLPAIEALA